MRIPVGLRIVVDIGSNNVDARAIFVPKGIRKVTVDTWVGEIRARATERLTSELALLESSKDGVLTQSKD